ncbi:tRNA (adenosine(37)-N6)-threonylcarbamoyltransferase complex ATPase subunit type 1 TsaE [Actinacidiphila acidipaludis]|uniref:tRNA threonylcarbamoyladenosine biosynthesis protein TsaE n=1 Tax=Actinacidiphila acidipaludis TaxID=2873382 RepID=A0ABS7QG88_9ACTN|nr:tRNA (adenosine(37)-N6)-threonylcarbamoyltransferase complex ATPase subunit type 1 TsaE [Streptomyces acidipaludis]MBY8881821.1 tRNA (adenosine(37)-N6)-threonylcarbamoyltransferase complex ATPase subunit type 1 TsaE [Streptomyces acidipaludis]
MGTPHDRYPAGTAEDAPAVRITVRTAERMRELGRRLAALLAPGDLVLLSGELGAGKTTLTRGLGEGLNVRGAVTSPTFVIARVHPSLTGGPALVHVDAYRLVGGLDEMEDLDLDVSLPESVVVVEWGEGKVEELSEARLQVVISRTIGGPHGTAQGAAPGAEDGTHTPAAGGGNGAVTADDVREVTVTGVGSRWAQEDLTALAR